MTWDEVRTAALRLPGVEDALSYGTPALKVRGRLVVRLDGDHLVLPTTPERKDLLLEAAPEVFFQTPHYHGWPIVLVRLGCADPSEVAGLVEASWRAAAPRRIVAAHDAGNAPPAPA